MPLNVPNAMTLARLILSVAVLGLLAAVDIGRHAEQRWLFQVAFWCFVAAAVSDALDGAIARRFGCVTTFGRITDPLVDKILVCGVFVLFMGDAFASSGGGAALVAPWMVILIIARELLVSTLRASQEAANRDFGANWAGKIKMILQSVTIGVILFRLGYGVDALAPAVAPLVWATVVVTVLSAVPYIIRAWSPPALSVRAAQLAQPDGESAGARGEAA